MQDNPFPFSGLSNEQVAASAKAHGTNTIAKSRNNALWASLKDVATEPMFLLLLACATIYFVLGELSEAWFMLGAIIAVSAISFYQDNRSRKALESLREFTQPHATVIRNNAVAKINSSEIVIGDLIVVSEGELVPADGRIIHLNDLSVNESILTGEAYAVIKDIHAGDDKIYKGTLVVSGLCVFETTAIGVATRLEQIGLSVEAIGKEKTPLQLQISSFVKWMALAGTVVFLLIWGINYLRTRELLPSLLKGLTIAMSVLPEEIPVAFATFMALGAWRLMRTGIIVKQTSTVEALGAATILCTDKTGTITENRMELNQVYELTQDRFYATGEWDDPHASAIVRMAMWASEPVPFDPMEQALHAAYAAATPVDERPHYHMIHEYPIGGKPPMMTHVFGNADGDRIIACKGAPEALIQVCQLTANQVATLRNKLDQMTDCGLRVLGVGTTKFDGNEFPAMQQDLKFEFVGLVAFYDPPKKNIAEVFEQLYKAGIRLKIITGDNLATTIAIAKQARIHGCDKAMTANDLLPLSEADFDKAALDNDIFARIHPELKFRIVRSLVNQGHIVGMTGDGVNDGPALKAAHIGIAMGKRGSELAKQSASLILTDDDFGKMVDAVAMGRRIYTNLKKAIQYIISIHIPIILTVALPLFLGWVYPAIFTPVHVIFLELIMGPTCSIVYENEPLEENSMRQPPRAITSTFFNLKELTISIVQGLAITAATLFSYQYGVSHGHNEDLVRSLVFTTLVIANIFLTLANRSFYHSVFTTLRYRNNLLSAMLLLTIVLLALLLYVPAFASFFRLQPLNGSHLMVAIVAAFISVAWFEVYKLIKRRSRRTF
ncbi:cation-translocating P-type ATPase [Polluticoccus soli]|uniref:cation-translocating P-type ATPase n=1 Tax=Polluticoccus soli TaxID=3034150 RepID=UPI0023E1A23A|nr:cation-translocating P-type ATPase [Flavipsychrobacter sp. JY13-12]